MLIQDSQNALYHLFPHSRAKFNQIRLRSVPDAQIFYNIVALDMSRRNYPYLVNQLANSAESEVSAPLILKPDIRSNRHPVHHLLTSQTICFLRAPFTHLVSYISVCTGCFFFTNRFLYETKFSLCNSTCPLYTENDIQQQQQQQQQ